MRPMRIVAGNTCHRLAFLKALALPQVLDLIGDVIFLWEPCLGQTIVILKRLAGAVGVARSPRLGPIAVALRAHLNQPFAGQVAWAHNGVRVLRLGMRSVIFDMLFSRTVALL